MRQVVDMGKVSPKDRETKGTRKERETKGRRQKRRLRSSSKKYLKPGALAQLRYSRGSVAKSCTDIGKKRVAVLDAKKAENNVLLEDKAVDESPLLLSPVNLVKQNNVMGTPKTPHDNDCKTESRLEALPIDVLVKVLCHLHHDQLGAAFHVSQRVRQAAVIARQFHFNYTTPDHSRQEMLRSMTELDEGPTEHWPFKRGDGKGVFMPSPHTPKAPRQGPRPPSRTKLAEMRQIAAVLFQESTSPSRCMVQSVLTKPPGKSLASNRALFYEEELCQAVAQNKLR